VTDLFAGAGTFSIPLALHSKVAAYEGEAGALTALDKAARQAPKLGVRIKTLTTERRDLHRRPLTARELKRVDGVVFDPPRAGAEAQCKELAKSPVRKIVAVSCNPATFARDARILIDGGFRLQKVAPVDQFLWTPHIEVVAFFSR
ncbi:MAG: RNA methyltransferase, partial [Pseudomonadota bacterium]